MRNFFVLVLVAFIVCACTKTVSTTYQPPKAIASNWDTLAYAWSLRSLDSSFVSNIISCPELDTSVLLYGDIKCFIRSSSTGYVSLFSGKHILENIDYAYALFPFSPTAGFYPYVITMGNQGSISLTLSDIPFKYSKQVLDLLEQNRKAKLSAFRYIIIPSASSLNARVASSQQDINTMDYHTLCKYLNIPE